ncbi:hypothetical protein DDI74_08355 [Chryseobacterium gleum]|jgi:hypothetical protein|uniref:hypothetical protein n=1 Tax=Chryseobacterium gleum TaxID=250 RepID=UPI00103D7AAE|nr:hypothetical protein [Chryseobacterium gleum]QBJ86263.1 hypothetical protein DDI74_08355 [Chryseobacterium gleum]
MTFLGYFTAVLVIFSLYKGYQVFTKFAANRQQLGKKGGLLEKVFLIFIISVIMISVNAMAFVLSFTFFWEKAYRTFDEPQYVATVVGYKKEITKFKNFSTSTYRDKVIFFPKVEYTDANGKKVIKTLDITTDYPPAMGQKSKITDKVGKDSTNTLQLDWVMFAAGCIFTGFAAFFASLISTYTTSYSMKKRMTLSFRIALLLIFINISCIVFIYLKS